MTFRYSTPVYALLIAFAAGLLYLPTLHNGFVWDDHGFIESNSVIKRIHPLNRFFVNQGVIKQRPGMLFSLALDHRLWGLNPFGYHLTNLLLHMITCLGVFWLGLNVLRSIRGAFVAAIFFVVHPVHAEAVAALLGRSDLLVAGACLGGFLFYIWSRRCSNGPVLLYYLLALFFYGAACLCKETGIVLLGWIFLYELFIFERRPLSLPQRVLWLLPFVLVLIGYLVFLRSIMGRTWGRQGWWGGDFLNDLMMSVQVYGEYFRLLVFPLRLSPWYIIPPPHALLNPPALLGACVFLFTLLAFFLAWLRRSPFGFYLGWYLICYLPLSNLVPIPGSMMAERWLYSGSIAFCLSLGLLWEKWISKLRPRCAISFVVVLLVLSGIRTITWIGVWRTDFSLLGMMLRDHPRFSGVHLWLGDTYLRQDSLIQAERQYRIALALDPDYPLVRISLARLYDRQGRFQQEVQEYQLALRLGGEHPAPHMGLGIANMHLGRYTEALVEYEKAYSSGAEQFNALLGIGDSYLQLGDTLRAKQAYLRALSEDPDFLEAKQRLAQLTR
jgi:protein O-mannosyl-transferase